MQNGIMVYGCENDEAELFRQCAAQYGVATSITDMPVTVRNAGLSAAYRLVSVSHKTNVTAPILQALHNCGVSYISTRSVGVNHIDMNAAGHMGICVENVAYSPDSVADHAVMLILMAARNAGRVLRRAQNQDFRLDSVRGKELRDMTVGVIGTGHIGQAVIKRLRGFGCRILAYDAHRSIGLDYVSLDTLLNHSDLITLHLPLTDATKHIINRERIARMKPAALLVNTGRGALVDTEALVDALSGGLLGGAALDVVEGEEGVFYRDCSDKPMLGAALMRLQALPNVTITPHTAFYTERALRETVENTIINCLNYERGKARWVK